MTYPPFLREMFQHAVSEGSRTNAINPLGWLILILTTGTLSAFYLSAPEWLGIAFLGATICTVVCYLTAYFYLLKNNPDALRSEKFYIQKLAIEKGIYGDSLRGTLQLEEIQGTKMISEHTADSKKED